MNAPDINRGLDQKHLDSAITYSQRAVGLDNTGHCDPTESRLVKAMSVRFPPNRSLTNGRVFEAAFVSEMRQLATAVDNDPDLWVWLGQGIMNQWAWNYYAADGTLRNETKVARDAFRRAISLNPSHPLALHLTVHLLEPSTSDDLMRDLLLAANALNATISEYSRRRPGTGHGHLLHMPGHAYLRTGNFHHRLLSPYRLLPPSTPVSPP